MSLGSGDVGEQACYASILAPVSESVAWSCRGYREVLEEIVAFRLWPVPGWDTLGHTGTYRDNRLPLIGNQADVTGVRGLHEESWPTTASAS